MNQSYLADTEYEEIKYNSGKTKKCSQFAKEQIENDIK